MAKPTTKSMIPGAHRAVGRRRAENPDDSRPSPVGTDGYNGGVTKGGTMHDNDKTGGATGELTRRLIDGFFRRFVWYLLPVVLFAGIGVFLAGRTSEEYASSGTLAVSGNPMVDEAEARGTEINVWENAALGTSRLINEQLSTDAFVRDVAERAGLGEALEAEFISTEIIRQQVGSRVLGENSIQVDATWADGPTAHRLVQSTIDAYRELVAEQVATDSNEAIDFWTARREEADLAATEAERELSEYVAGLPPLRTGEENYPLTDQLKIQRLNDAYDEALEVVDNAQSRIDDAQLNVLQVQSEAGRQIRVIDPPEVPLAPASTTVKRLITVAMMMFVGALVSLTALVITTLLDRTVRSRSQLAAVVGTSATASVPRIKAFKRGRRERRADKKAAA